ncbi:MAG: hypothetical protein PVF07_05640 [Thiogranum sp.]|jgi:hypothetical protein
MIDENPILVGCAAPVGLIESDGYQHPQPGTVRTVRRDHRCDTGVIAQQR